MLYVPVLRIHIAVHADTCCVCRDQITDQAPDFSDAVWSTHSRRCHLEALRVLRPAVCPVSGALLDCQSCCKLPHRPVLVGLAVRSEICMSAAPALIPARPQVVFSSHGASSCRQMLRQPTRPLRRQRAGCSCEAAKGFAPSGKTGSKVSLLQLLYLSVCEAHLTHQSLIRVSGRSGLPIDSVHCCRKISASLMQTG